MKSRRAGWKKLGCSWEDRSPACSASSLSSTHIASAGNVVTVAVWVDSVGPSPTRLVSGTAAPDPLSQKQVRSPSSSRANVLLSSAVYPSCSFRLANVVKIVDVISTEFNKLSILSC